MYKHHIKIMVYTLTCQLGTHFEDNPTGSAYLGNFGFIYVCSLYSTHNFF